jgi:hypothetical protein
MDLYEEGGAKICTVYSCASQIFTLSAPTKLRIVIAVTGGLKLTDELFYPMVVNSMVTNAVFNRSNSDCNIKTINGHDRVDVVIDDSYAY